MEEGRLDTEVYGTAWRPMGEAPRDAARLLKLLVPDRPEVKVVTALWIDGWMLSDGTKLPDDQPPCGWMFDSLRPNWHDPDPVGLEPTSRA